jgi:hypothetical protein
VVGVPIAGGEGPVAGPRVDELWFSAASEASVSLPQPSGGKQAGMCVHACGGWVVQ